MRAIYKCGGCRREFVVLGDDTPMECGLCGGRSVEFVKHVSDRMRTLCVDFDGVIHSYDSGWMGACVIPDPPVPGAIRWLQTLLNTSVVYEVAIYSSRSREYGAVSAMKRWLLDNGLREHEVLKIKFPTQKPAAYLTIDDRAVCFRGTFPSEQELDAFRPWNK